MSRLPVRTKPRRTKHCYVGPPAIFRLGMAVRQINEAWPHLDSFGCYLVGSCLERPDFRDVDVRMIMPDDAFRREFPDVGSIDHASWEHDPKWLLLTVAIGEWLGKQTGLLVDFQFQPQSYANGMHAGARQALGLHYVPRRREAAE
ncbi:hypothetical protein [Bradyrhizobium sp. CCBAU 11434]|uniref:hypothetical protein n=1 Tax=Bradyrhizobium sp. CCBAU 11434 TaxID=1630885 RepID=UPI002305C180|nr:hypothetical protein [Bradyrhizobium sp. CCBAU 11434]